MKNYIRDLGKVCAVLALAIGLVLVCTVVGCAIMALWGVAGKIVLTIEALLMFVGVIVGSWDRLDH